MRQSSVRKTQLALIALQYSKAKERGEQLNLTQFDLTPEEERKVLGLAEKYSALFEIQQRLGQEKYSRIIHELVPDGEVEQVKAMNAGEV